MGDNKQEKAPLTVDTQIVFTLKSFVGTILTILGMFIGFYTLVIVPTINSHKEELKSYKEETNKKYDKINDQLIEINGGIGIINGNIDGINNRFRDLNQIRSQQSGSFGN